MKTEIVPNCPMCGGSGHIEFTNCKDYICNLPGSWNYRRCDICKSLWIDPRPSLEEITNLYPENYYITHQALQNFLIEPQGMINKLKYSVKLSVLEYRFGYNGLTNRLSSNVLKFISKFFIFAPGVKNRIGNIIRHIKFVPVGSLLEVGCGNGGYINTFFMYSK